MWNDYCDLVFSTRENVESNLFEIVNRQLYIIQEQNLYIKCHNVYIKCDIPHQQMSDAYLGYIEMTSTINKKYSRDRHN